MKSFFKDKKIKKKIRVALLFFLSIIGILIYVLIDFFNGKVSIVRYPSCKDGVMDFTGYEISEQYYKIEFKGEVEFYYNTWLLTDEVEEKENPILLDVPQYWTGLKIDGKKLPKTGYCTYRFTMTNLPRINVMSSLSTDSSYRMYFNGVLMGVVGTPSKTERSSDYYRNYERKAYRVPDDGVVEVIIELGYNDHGGLNEFPGMYCYNVWSSGHYAVYRASTILVVGLFILAILISLVINFSLQKEGKFFLCFMLLGFLAHLLLSFDTLFVIRAWEIYLNVVLFEKLYFLSLVFICSIFIFYLEKLKIIKLNKIYWIVYPILMVLNYILFWYLYGTKYLWISYCILLFAIFPCVFKLIKNVKIDSFEYIYEVMLAIIFDMIILEMLDISNIIKTNGFIATTSFSFVFMVVIMIVYFKRLMALNYSEIEKRDLAIESLQLKQDNLIKQIKPHFIYNSLEAIQAVYHKNIEEGDQGLQYFARYLRTNVDAINGGMISFTEELDNIINYVNLKNLGIEKKYNLQLEIEYEDFNLPMLSIEPIIENSVKYSKVNLKEDGYIRISSKLLDNRRIQICIEDNGIGFDVNQVSNTSKGLLNAKTRLEMALNATVEIESTIGKGTIAYIEFENTES